MMAARREDPSPMSECLPEHRLNWLLEYFDDLPDPRVAACCMYPLQEMLLVALCAVTCDADDWVHVAEWGAAKLPWWSPPARSSRAATRARPAPSGATT
jgi:hypothetical protein